MKSNVGRQPHCVLLCPLHKSQRESDFPFGLLLINIGMAISICITISMTMTMTIDHDHDDPDNEEDNVHIILLVSNAAQKRLLCPQERRY